jgi:hypothetical protein
MRKPQGRVKVQNINKLRAKKGGQPFQVLPAFHLLNFKHFLVLEEILNGIVGNHLLIKGVRTGLRVLHHLDNLGV